MIRAVVFDFDGLIVDTETVWFEVYRDLLREKGIELPMEAFTACIGSTDAAFFDYIRQYTDLEEVVLKKMAFDRYQERKAGLVLREGVIGYLNEGKELGIPLAIASSSRRVWIDEFSKKFGITDYFSVIVTADDVGTVKPAPDLYLKAAERLGIDPREAVAFEDSLNGSIAAFKAGMPCVIVPNEVTAGLPFADYTLRLTSMKERTLSEVIDFVEKQDQM